MDVDSDLPFVDEHEVVVSASAAVVWAALTAHLTRSGPAGPLAHVLGAEPRRGSSGPFGEGATVPGFAVARIVPERHLRLAGRHRFSRYALVWTLTPRADGTLLSARTEARFPGLSGRFYRTLVISSGAHRVLTRRLLHTIRRRAERTNP